ncbi:MAG: hypothetical protein DI539_28820 [Flavobacterium psychrophilum]|nr:MAG: hypothetical protein DI539_28820 [Flavobacterium psychrophilum]
MKKLLTIALILPVFAFSQSNDLTKKEAFQAFKISELRKSNEIPINRFEKIYAIAKCVQKNYADKENFPQALQLRTMPIFSKKISKDIYEAPNGCGAHAEFCIYGVTMDFLIRDYKGEELEKLKKDKTTCIYLF